MKKPKPVIASAAEAIDFLGGPQTLSRLLFGVDEKRPMVAMWKTRGKIPGDWREPVAQAVRKKGGVISETFYEQKRGNGFKPVEELYRLTDEDQAFAPEVPTK